MLIKHLVGTKGKNINVYRLRFDSQDFLIITKNGHYSNRRSEGLLEAQSNFHCTGFSKDGCIERKCMLKVIAKARQLNLPIRLQVLKVNPRTQIFYENLGFVSTGKTDTHILMERIS